MSPRWTVCHTRQLALVYVVVSLALLTSCSPSSQPAIKGSWTGTVRQPGYPPYSVEMTITATKVGQIAGTVAYPELGCSGTLRCEEVSVTHVTFRESILENSDGSCVDGAKIVLTIKRAQPERAAITFFTPDGSPAGNGELERIDAQ